MSDPYPIASIDKNGREQLRVELSEFKGYHQLEVEGARILVLRRDGDAEGSLLRAPGALVGPVARLFSASVAAAVHSRQL